MYDGACEAEAQVGAIEAAIELTVRQEEDLGDDYAGSGRFIGGTFYYRTVAVIRDRGSVRKETIAPGAFRYALEDEERPIDLLRGHSFDQPLASRQAGTLELEDSAESLKFRARLPPLREQPAYMRDAVKMTGAGLIQGISPGFRLPPASAIRNPERLLPEPGNPGVKIRQVDHAVLREMSLVTAPAYRGGTVIDLSPAEYEVRAEQLRRQRDAERRVRLWL